MLFRPTVRSVAPLLIVSASLGAATPTRPSEQPVAPAHQESAEPGLPALPDGVTHLRFADLFHPPGRKGFEFTERARALNGQRVRLLGHMVRHDAAVAGRLLLAPYPLTLIDREYGLSDDLPITTVFATLPGEDSSLVVPHVPGLLLLTGRLELGHAEEPDGRVSFVRLQVEKPDDAAPLRPHPFASGTSARRASAQPVP